VIVESDKARRLTFAQGYEDAWARRAAQSEDREYRDGYDEGRKDREIKDRR
jgi:hypothetical protein